MKPILQGLSKFLVGIAALLFVFGGGVISMVNGTDRFLGELVGIGLAFVFGFLALIAYHVADNMDENGGSEG